MIKYYSGLNIPVILDSESRVPGGKMLISGEGIPLKNTSVSVLIYLVCASDGLTCRIRRVVKKYLTEEIEFHQGPFKTTSLKPRKIK